MPYAIKPINIGKGEQSDPEFLKISPNNRIPAIVDHEPADEGEPLSIFESGAILEFLAIKAGAYLPSNVRGRTEVMQWLFWQMGGLGPMLGQNHHFEIMPRKKSPTPSNAIRKKPSGFTACSTSDWKTGSLSPVIIDRRHGVLSLDRAARTPGPGSQRVSQPQALVRDDSKAAGGRARLRAREND